MKKHLPTFVLLVVIIWYTAVNPGAARTVGPRPGIRYPDGEDSDPKDEAGRQFERAGINGRGRSDGPLLHGAAVDDLDWPEFLDG